MITTKQLEQWKALAEAGAEYVVIAPASLAALLSEVERLRAELAQMEEYSADIGGTIDRDHGTIPYFWQWHERKDRAKESTQ